MRHVSVHVRWGGTYPQTSALFSYSLQKLSGEDSRGPESRQCNHSLSDMSRDHHHPPWRGELVPPELHREPVVGSNGRPAQGYHPQMLGAPPPGADVLWDVWYRVLYGLYGRLPQWTWLQRAHCHPVLHRYQAYVWDPPLQGLTMHAEPGHGGWGRSARDG